MSSSSFPATLRLPHPYLTTYRVHEVNRTSTSKLLQIRHEARTCRSTPTQQDGQSHETLHSEVTFNNPAQDAKDEDLPPMNINTFWGRVRRSPKSDFAWTATSAPSLGQLWLIVYALFTLRPELEYFRVSLVGEGHQELAKELKKVGLACQHPVPEGKSSDSSEAHTNELVMLRSTFWQGAGSPFGSRPIWAPETHRLSSTGKELSAYPLPPLDYTTSTKFPEARIHSFHPRRPQKPTPGAVIYSRYIPHLDEHFSMVALDYTNDEHLRLFHDWQNDPRVSAGWNETGTLDQHRTYLRNLHEDPHTMTMLAKFDDIFFAYYEVYWAKEDHFGVYCDAGDFDRGRHSLVGDIRFRGAHRVSAWWSSLMHYLFLDEPRTLFAVGEPKATNATVLSYDLMCGFGVQKFVDLPHKRSAFMKCSRERFFQICPLAFNGERNVAGTGIKLFAKL